MINILDYIPVGHDNAATERDIARWAHVSQRHARELISSARYNNVILNMQDGHGYFVPDEGEEELIKDWVEQETNRLRRIGSGLHKAREVIKNAR